MLNRTNWKSFLLVLLIGLVQAASQCPGTLQAQRYDVSNLVGIESKVKDVIEKTLETCVSITDGLGEGSGVIVSEDGLILTAGHVMTSRTRPYDIVLPSGRRAKAVALGKNLNVDAGMLQITDPGPWPFVEISDDRPRNGEWVVSLGHSGGFELGRNPPVRTGRILGMRNGQLVSDAVLIGGDSGGPLFNLEGELVGIHSSIGDSIAENRHVPISTYRKHWSQMEKGEQWGTLPQLATKKKSRNNKKSEPRKPARMGVRVDTSGRVTRVYDNSAAERAGLKVGDVIKSFGRVRIKNGTHLIDLIKTKNPDESFSIEYIRDGVLHIGLVKLEEFKK